MWTLWGAADSASSMMRSSSTSKLMSLTLKDMPRLRRPPYTGGPLNHCWRYMPWARDGSAPRLSDFTLLQKVRRAPPYQTACLVGLREALARNGNNCFRPLSK